MNEQDFYPAGGARGNIVTKPADLPRFVRCECSMATRVLGDGCRYCNPELGAELKWNSEADDYNQWDDLGQDEKDHLIAEFISANGSSEVGGAPQEGGEHE